MRSKAEARGGHLTARTVVRFAVVSLVPIVTLGWILGVQARDSIRTRTADVYATTTNAIFNIVGELVIGPGDFEPGAVFPPERAALVDELITRLGADPRAVRVLIADRDGRVIYANQAIDRGTTLPRSEQLERALDGTPASRFVSRSIDGSSRRGDAIEMYQPVRFADDATVHGVIAATGIESSGLVDSIERDVTSVRRNLVLGLVALWVALLPIAMSVSRRLRRTALDNEHLALHDALTGLPNRNLLRDRLDHAIAVTARTGNDVGLLLIDLDGFKEVNDTLGHGKGDELLRLVADRLRSCVRTSDTVARLGGDEFAIVATCADAGTELADLAQRVTHVLSDSVVLDGIEVAVKASIGGSIHPNHATDAEELLRHADIAMYAAKASGDPFALYDTDIDLHSPSRLALAAELRRAIDQEGQLVMHYQPIADPLTGEVVGLEGLVRWEHPRRGLLSPIEFLPIAEGSGLMRSVTARAVDLAVGQLRVWLDSGLDVMVSVNLSASDLRTMAIVDVVQGALRRHHVPGTRLELEVTETAVLASPERAVEVLSELRALGVRIAVDDFGTGYASLTYLKRLRPDRLKIDRSFVGAMVNDATDGQIVSSLIALAHGLSMDVTAEGVESQEQWNLLAALGCDLVQGYHLSPPVDDAAATEWLIARASNVTSAVVA